MTDEHRERPEAALEASRVSRIEAFLSSSTATWETTLRVRLSD